ASPAVFAARLVQERMGRPMATIVLQPWMIPSIEAPLVIPGLTLPRWAPSWVGRLYYRMLDIVGGLLTGRELNRLRSSIRLPPVNAMFRWWFSPEQILGLFPAWFGPPQTDWPRQMRLTGFPLYDGRPPAQLLPEVRDWCLAGKPPIVFTFGTGMIHGT